MQNFALILPNSERAEREGLAAPGGAVLTDPRVGGLKQNKCWRYRALAFLICPLWRTSSPRYQMKNAPDKVGSTCFVSRRGRDSNPRKFDLQRFSRPPQSTALPPLRVDR